jgi:hypothetical protein
MAVLAWIWEAAAAVLIAVVAAEIALTSRPGAYGNLAYGNLAYGHL